MLSTRIATALIAVFVPILTANCTHARDNFEYEKRSHREGQKQRSYYGGNGVTSYIRNVGAYSGSAFAIREPRNGTYVSADGAVSHLTKTSGGWDRPQIIRINAKTMDEACSYEAGVCVIRP